MEEPSTPEPKMTGNRLVDDSRRNVNKLLEKATEIAGRTKVPPREKPLDAVDRIKKEMDEVKHLQKDLDSHTERRGHNTTLHEQLEEAEAAVEDIEMNITDLKAQIGENQMERDELESRIHYAQEELEMCNKRLPVVLEVLHELGIQKDDANGNLTEAHAEVSKKRVLVNEAEESLKAIMSAGLTSVASVADALIATGGSPSKFSDKWTTEGSIIDDDSDEEAERKKALEITTAKEESKKARIAHLWDVAVRAVRLGLVAHPERFNFMLGVGGYGHRARRAGSPTSPQSPSRLEFSPSATMEERPASPPATNAAAIHAIAEQQAQIKRLKGQMALRKKKFKESEIQLESMRDRYDHLRIELIALRHAVSELDGDTIEDLQAEIRFYKKERVKLYDQLYNYKKYTLPPVQRIYVDENGDETGQNGTYLDRMKKKIGDQVAKSMSSPEGRGYQQRVILRQEKQISGLKEQLDKAHLYMDRLESKLESVERTSLSSFDTFLNGRASRDEELQRIMTEASKMQERLLTKQVDERHRHQEELKEKNDKIDELLLNTNVLTDQVASMKSTVENAESDKRKLKEEILNVQRQLEIATAPVSADDLHDIDEIISTLKRNPSGQLLQAEVDGTISRLHDLAQKPATSLCEFILFQHLDILAGLASNVRSLFKDHVRKTSGGSTLCSIVVTKLRELFNVVKRCGRRVAGACGEIVHEIEGLHVEKTTASVYVQTMNHIRGFGGPGSSGLNSPASAGLVSPEMDSFEIFKVNKVAQTDMTVDVYMTTTETETQASVFVKDVAVEALSYSGLGATTAMSPDAEKIRKMEETLKGQMTVAREELQKAKQRAAFAQQEVKTALEARAPLEELRMSLEDKASYILGLESELAAIAAVKAAMKDVAAQLPDEDHRQVESSCQTEEVTVFPANAFGEWGEDMSFNEGQRSPQGNGGGSRRMSLHKKGHSMHPDNMEASLTPGRDGNATPASSKHQGKNSRSKSTKKKSMAKLAALSRLGAGGRTPSATTPAVTPKVGALDGMSDQSMSFGSGAGELKLDEDENEMSINAVQGKISASRSPRADMVVTPGWIGKSAVSPSNKSQQQDTFSPTSRRSSVAQSSTGGLGRSASLAGSLNEQSQSPPGVVNVGTNTDPIGESSDAIPALSPLTVPGGEDTIAFDAGAPTRIGAHKEIQTDPVMIETAHTDDGASHPSSSSCVDAGNNPPTPLPTMETASSPLGTPAAPLNSSVGMGTSFSSMDLPAASGAPEMRDDGTDPRKTPTATTETGTDPKTPGASRTASAASRVASANSKSIPSRANSTQRLVDRGSSARSLRPPTGQKQADTPSQLQSLPGSSPEATAAATTALLQQLHIHKERRSVGLQITASIPVPAVLQNMDSGGDGAQAAGGAAFLSDDGFEVDEDPPQADIPAELRVSVEAAAAAIVTAEASQSSSVPASPLLNSSSGRVQRTSSVRSTRSQDSPGGSRRSSMTRGSTRRTSSSAAKLPAVKKLEPVKSGSKKKDSSPSTASTPTNATDGKLSRSNSTASQSGSKSKLRVKDSSGSKTSLSTKDTTAKNEQDQRSASGTPIDGSPAAATALRDASDGNGDSHKASWVHVDSTNNTPREGSRSPTQRASPRGSRVNFAPLASSPGSTSSPKNIEDEEKLIDDIQEQLVKQFEEQAQLMQEEFDLKEAQLRRTIEVQKVELEEAQEQLTALGGGDSDVASLAVSIKLEQEETDMELTMAKATVESLEEQLEEVRKINETLVTRLTAAGGSTEGGDWRKGVQANRANELKQSHVEDLTVRIRGLMRQIEAGHVDLGLQKSKNKELEHQLREHTDRQDMLKIAKDKDRLEVTIQITKLKSDLAQAHQKIREYKKELASVRDDNTHKDKEAERAKGSSERKLQNLQSMINTLTKEKTQLKEELAKAAIEGKYGNFRDIQDQVEKIRDESHQEMLGARKDLASERRKVQAMLQKTGELERQHQRAMESAKQDEKKAQETLRAENESNALLNAKERFAQSRILRVHGLLMECSQLIKNSLRLPIAIAEPENVSTAKAYFDDDSYMGYDIEKLKKINQIVLDVAATDCVVLKKIMTGVREWTEKMAKKKLRRKKQDAFSPSRQDGSQSDTDSESEMDEHEKRRKRDARRRSQSPNVDALHTRQWKDPVKERESHLKSPNRVSLPFTPDGRSVSGVDETLLLLPPTGKRASAATKKGDVSDESGTSASEYDYTSDEGTKRNTVHRPRRVLRPKLTAEEAAADMKRRQENLRSTAFSDFLKVQGSTNSPPRQRATTPGVNSVPHKTDRIAEILQSLPDRPSTTIPATRSGVSTDGLAIDPVVHGPGATTTTTTAVVKRQTTRSVGGLQLGAGRVISDGLPKRVGSSHRPLVGRHRQIIFERNERNKKLGLPDISDTKSVVAGKSFAKQ